MSNYIALIESANGAYGVYFPDLPGCTAMGHSPEQAWSNAIAALADWIEETETQGDVPVARTLDALKADEEVREALAEGAAFITVPLLRESGRPVKANISLDKGLLDAIDAAATRVGLTRSAFLASAARDKILAG
jgi:predicted RNase H-like HicB family nuclease